MHPVLRSLPAGALKTFIPLINWAEATVDGRANLAWRIAWRNGHPTLVGHHEGEDGQPYIPANEYRHFARNYRLRQFCQQGGGRGKR